MREKLIELLEQAKYCSAEELADYLLAAGVVLPVRVEGYSFKGRDEIDFDYNSEDV